jgi:hypothetical protein
MILDHCEEIEALVTSRAVMAWVFKTEASRERANSALGAVAVSISIIGLFFNYLQYCSAEKARTGAAQEAARQREDAKTTLEQQRTDAKATLEQQRNDAAMALRLQIERADKANQLTASLAASNRRSLELMSESNRPIILINAVNAHVGAERYIQYEVSVVNDGTMPALNSHAACSGFTGQMPIPVAPVNAVTPEKFTLCPHDIRPKISIYISM